MGEQKLAEHQEKYDRLLMEYDLEMDELERRRIQYDLNNLQMILDYYEIKLGA